MAVFPKLRHGDVASASPAAVKEWDSLNHIRLITVIGEVFGLELEYEEFESVLSYAAFRQRLLSRDI
jgi:acyl carrier protein